MYIYQKCFDTYVPINYSCTCLPMYIYAVACNSSECLLSNSKLTNGVCTTGFLHFTLKTKLCSTKQEILIWSLCEPLNVRIAQ